MSRHPRLRRLVAGLLATGALAVPVTLVPTTASALPCDPNGGCRHGIAPKGPDWMTGWILYADKDGRGSYWTWGVYYQDKQGHCFDTKGIGVGCPG